MATKPKLTTKFYKKIFNAGTERERVVKLTCFIGPLEFNIFNAGLYLEMSIEYPHSVDGAIPIAHKSYNYWYSSRYPHKHKSLMCEDEPERGYNILRPTKLSLAAFMEEFTRAEAELAALLPQM